MVLDVCMQTDLTTCYDQLVSQADQGMRPLCDSLTVSIDRLAGAAADTV